MASDVGDLTINSILQLRLAEGDVYDELSPTKFETPLMLKQPPPTERTLYGIPVFDTFAEAFGMTGTRLIITAVSHHWAKIAAQEATGYGSSVISCDAEAGIESKLSADQTPDGRPGYSILLFAFSRDALAKAVLKRVGQCVLTCATSACYNGVQDGDPEKTIALGSSLRYFGDGFQASKVIGSNRYWRIPVMDGEFVCEENAGTFKGVAGGNLLLGAETPEQALSAVELTVEAMTQMPGIIAPFPGGVVRSGSKVGSRYPQLRASTFDAYCPSLRARTETKLPPQTGCVYEIVVDGVNESVIRDAMKVGLHTACRTGNLKFVSAGNYGGKLGKHLYPLHELIDDAP